MNGVATGADLLLDHGDLLLDLTLSARADDGHLDAQVSGGGVAAGLHIAPVLRGQGLQDDGDLDVAGSGVAGGLFSSGVVSGLLGSGVAAAGHQGQSHDQSQEQCKEFFHASFSFCVCFDFRRL
jgi:hypothetical protein